MILNYSFEQGQDVYVTICVTIIQNSVQYKKHEVWLSHMIISSKTNTSFSIMNDEKKVTKNGTQVNLYHGQVQVVKTKGRKTCENQWIMLFLLPMFHKLVWLLKLLL